jgi:hypothetical protein
MDIIFGRKETRLKTEARMGSEWFLGRLAGDVWSGFIWLRIGTSGRLL